jgi:hypothetical protein
MRNRGGRGGHRPPYGRGDGGFGARETFGGGPLSSRHRRSRSALLSSGFGGTFDSSFDIATERANDLPRSGALAPFPLDILPRIPSGRKQVYVIRDGHRVRRTDTDTDTAGTQPAEESQAGLYLLAVRPPAAAAKLLRQSDRAVSAGLG